MSFTEEAYVRGDGFVPDRGKCTGVPLAGHRGPQRPGLSQGLQLGPPHSGEVEGGLTIPKDFEFKVKIDWEEMEAASMALHRREGLPTSPADEKGGCWDFMPHLATESAAIMQELTSWEPSGTQRYLFPDSSAAGLSTIWANTEAGLSGRGALALSSLETQLAPPAPLCHPSGPEGSRAWRNPQRRTKSRIMVNREAQRLPVIPEYSDVFNELQLMRVSVYPRGGGQATFNSSKELGGTASSTNACAWGEALHMRGPPMSSAPGGLTSAMEKQALEELEAGSSKKSVLWSKGGSRPSFLGATVSAAASGGLPRASSRKKPIQEKKSLGDGSKATVGRTFPSWGHTIKAAPLEPATFPPVSGVPLLGMSKRHSSLPLEPKQAKHSGSGKRSTAKKTWESQPVACEDSGLNRDPVPPAQLSMHRPGTSTLFMHPGEISRSNRNARVFQPPGNSQPWDLGQGGLISRAPTSFGNQQSAVHPLIRERQQQPPGALGCPWCVALQKERDDLQEQIAAMQSLTDKFQAL